MWPSTGGSGVASTKYSVMRPFGISGELHVTTREVEVAVTRDTEPTSAGTTKRKTLVLN